VVVRIGLELEAFESLGLRLCVLGRWSRFVSIQDQKNVHNKVARCVPKNPVAILRFRQIVILNGLDAHSDLLRMTALVILCVDVILEKSKVWVSLSDKILL
jgi:hypothetical protein